MHRLAPKNVSGAGLRILVVHTRWNAEIVARLVAGTTDTLASLGVAPGHIDVADVPGAFELPFAAQQLLRAAAARGAPYAACVAIGVLIKGSTMHFEYISDAACHGLMDVGLRTGFPVILGVLTCLTEEQARERAGAGADPARSHNHGIDWAVSAVEMALLSQPTRA